MKEGKGTKRRRRWNKGDNPSKKIKRDHKGHPKVNYKDVSVGRGPDIDNRHAYQLESLLSLMTVKRRPLEIVDDKDKVLKDPSCSYGVFMEWSKKDDEYFLWGSTTDGKLLIKFEFHGGFEASADLLVVRNPVLVFSDSFVCNHNWREVKKMLEELFGNANEVPVEDHDYMLAFTRSREILHFCVFKLHMQPTPDMESMRLEEVSPSFILKPLEIHRPSDDSTEDIGMEVFIDEDRLMLEMKNDLKLVAYSVLYDNSCQPMVPHTMQHAISHKVGLQLPVKILQWLGFNTNCQEFFQRYHAYKRTHVPGTGSDPTATSPTESSARPSPTALSATPVYYDHITVPMKVFSRGLIMCVKENHIYGTLSDFGQKNVFLRRGHVVIVGVKLLPYSKEQAVKNFHSVWGIIMLAIKGMVVPPDLQAVLDLLYDDPIGSYTIIKNNFAWMLASQRSNMIAELHEIFSELGPNDQLNLTKTLPDMDQWLTKFASNRLLFDVQTDKLPPTSVTSLEAMEKYFQKKAAEMQRRAVKANDPTDLLQTQNPIDELKLYTGRRYFKGVRNSYVHLSGTSIKQKMGALPIETVDLVVCSQFAAICSDVQLKVPAGYKRINEERASHKRFKAFFGPVETIEFTAVDEK